MGGSAAERLATEDMRLAAITDIDAFSALAHTSGVLSDPMWSRTLAAGFGQRVPALIAFLNGEIARCSRQMTNLAMQR